MRTTRLAAAGLILIIITISWTGIQPPDCKSIQTGTFYFYPPDQKDGFKLIRNESMQVEVELKTKDTSFWKIQWVNDCVCTSTFISTTKKKVPKEFLSYVKSHIMYMEVVEVNEKNYKMRIYTDSLSNKEYYEDVVWRNPK